jgi:Cu/Ag efflux protein CusF
MKIIGTCLAVVLLAAPAAAATPAAVAATENARMATAGGMVASIDMAAKSLVVKVEGQQGDAHDMTFVVAEDSKLLKDGAAVTLEDLKQGDKVTVTYKAQSGKNVVVNIGVESKT